MEKLLDTNKEFAILVDSYCAVPEKYLINYPIYVIPARINYNDEPFKDIEISSELVHKSMEEEIRKVSFPAYNDVNKVFEKVINDGYTKIIAVNIFGNLRDTDNIVQLVIDKYTANGIKFYHLDTSNIAIASGLYAVSAGDYLKEGKSYEDTINILAQDYEELKVFLRLWNILVKGAEVYE